jgi:phosphoglycolate phosphatase-like HAD superfamily hydrolase
MEPKPTSRRTILLGVTASITAASLSRYASAQTPAEPLPSWNDGPSKQAILDFVRATITQSDFNFVAPDDRIATFDQDGTLWVEHPAYAQAMFALERVHTLAAQHPEWKDQEPFKSVLANDEAAIAKFSERDWAKIIFITHAGMSQADFQDIVRKWLATARHPRFKRRYTELVYQPMREVMDYLRTNGFKTYIVTGGGQDFVRAYAQRVYGVPPEQVIGTILSVNYEIKGAQPELIRQPKLLLDDDHAGKAIGIDLFIGKRPYASFGNSTAIARCWNGRERAPARGSGCWCIMTMGSGNMPMVRLADPRTPRSAPSISR